MALDAAITSAIIAAGTSAALGGTSMGVQAARNKKQWRYQKEAMQMQNQMNIDNWKMQNEYNSPKAQMERYTDAGLNPSLVYGNSISNGNATSSPTTQVATHQVPHGDVKYFDNVVNSYMQAKQLALAEKSQLKQLEYQDAQIEEIKDRIETSDVQRSLLLVDKLRKELDYRVTDYDFNEKQKNRNYRDNMLKTTYNQALENLSKTQVENKISNYNLTENLPLQTEQFKLANEAQTIRNEFMLYNTDNLREEMSRNEWRFEQELIKSGYSEEKAKLELKKFKKDIDKIDQEVTNLQQEFKLNRWEAVRKWLELGQKSYNDNKKNQIKMLESFGEIIPF